MVRKRYTYMNEQFFSDNPNVLTTGAHSLDARLDVELIENPKLGAKAAAKAIEEWGQPATSITHLVFHSYSGVQMPGADYKLVKYLGLKPSVKRFMIYHNGCFAGGTVLRLAKDLAENNAGARVLVVCSETMLNGFHAPDESRMDHLVAYAIFGDGAAAAIVGADPDLSIERPIFEMILANQTLVPESDGALMGRYQEIGFVVTLGKDVPTLVSSKIEDCLVQAYKDIGVSDWNSLFYAIHPGGAAILNAIEAKLSLSGEKLEATREVLREFGNMSSPTVIFVLDEMRKRSLREGKSTTGDGLEWGVLFGIGPGLTVETIVLRSCPTA